MKRILLAAVAAIVLSVGVGSVANAAPHGGHGYASHAHGHRSSFRVYTPSFSFGYGGYGGYGCGGYGGYGGGYGYSGHHGQHRGW